METKKMPPRETARKRQTKRTNDLIVTHVWGPGVVTDADLDGLARVLLDMILRDWEKQQKEKEGGKQ